ncbi:MAG: lysophospholipase [Actinomycetota bacterium]|nr:lysophospholipase [Actinomycetota bacterium]
MRRSRTIDPVHPARTGRHHGLAYGLWLPAGAAAPAAGVLVLHGAGSQKESHHDFARAAIATGLAVLVFDQRGHGESEGALDGRMLTDVAAMAELLRGELAAQAPLALRGSSMGGFLAILAAQPARARAVVAICPASAGGLRRGLERDAYDFRADREQLLELLDSVELQAAVSALAVPLLLLHARGDEQVPVEHSRELSAVAHAPGSRLIEVPGGHHRSVQHDEELQAVSLRWLHRALDPGGKRVR